MDMLIRQGSVLCVDDEPNIVRSLKWLLQKDFDVATALDGATALELVKENDFDVVISDQRMPRMSGVELLREVRRVSPRSMRILLTGYSDMQAVIRSVNESEVFRFINKPWNISELPKVVAQAVGIARTKPVGDDSDEAVDDNAPVSRQANILVLDDDPEMARTVSVLVGESARVSHSANLAEAVGILDSEAVSVIVSELQVGSVDATRLVRVMKSRHPHVVSVMLSGESDFESVVQLINQGQIYRFVPKPVRSGYLKLVIDSALRKHCALVEQPELADRHAVEEASADTVDALVSDVTLAARQSAARNHGSGTGLMASIGAGLRRLFGV